MAINTLPTTTVGLEIAASVSSVWILATRQILKQPANWFGYQDLIPEVTGDLRK